MSSAMTRSVFNATRVAHYLGLGILNCIRTWDQRKQWKQVPLQLSFGPQDTAGRPVSSGCGCARGEIGLLYKWRCSFCATRSPSLLWNWRWCRLSAQVLVSDLPPPHPSFPTFFFSSCFRKIMRWSIIINEIKLTPHLASVSLSFTFWRMGWTCSSTWKIPDHITLGRSP